MNARRSTSVRHRGAIIALLVVSTASLAICGCGSSSRSVTKEQTVYKTEAAPGEAGQTQTVKETTIIKEKESHGLVGRFFILIGDVVALPFKMIAMVFDTVI